MKLAIDRKWRGILMAGLIFAVSSCMPDPLEDGPQPITGDPAIELTANAAFDWSTDRAVTISVTGLELPVDVQRRLTLMTAAGDVFYAGLQSMGSDFSMEFTLPNHVGSVRMSYGTIEKELEISSNKVAFDYIVELEDTDLDE